MDASELLAAANRSFAERAAVGRALDGLSADMATTCHAMALRFHRGGKLLVFGNGGPTTDAQHVSVEFVHPVIVGKRALPALSLANDAATVMGIAERHGVEQVFTRQLAALATPDDIALGISADGADLNVLRALELAHGRGLLTVALTGGDGGALAASPAIEHCLVVPSADHRVVKEAHVTLYHVLWELVHVFFDQPAVLEAESEQATEGHSSALEALYPFLYARPTSLPAVLEEVSHSTGEKVAEALALREAAGEREGAQLTSCATAIAASYAAGGKVLAFGNGGSSTDAQDVVRSYLDPLGDGAPLPALCLTNDVAVVTALSNDVGFEVVFARQLRAFGRAGDVAIGISTSGGSPNVLRALDEAKAMGMTTVGLTGYGGGKMAELGSVDYLFAVPSSSVHRVQEVQTTLYHVLEELTRLALPAAIARAGDDGLAEADAAVVGGDPLVGEHREAG